MPTPAPSDLKSSLEKRLRDFMADESSDHFANLALDIFTYQFHANSPYQVFSKHLNLSPEAIAHWQEIPAVPTSAFRIPAHPLHCGEAIKTTFLTSGTTTELRGSHHFSDTGLYEQAIERSIDHALPSLKIPTFFLAPSAREAPHSSLSHMLAHLNSGDDSHFLLQDSKLHLQPLFQHLASEQPVSLMGTALAFRHLMEIHGPIPLPAGSQILETGGYKGSSIILSKPELYEQLSSFFAIPPTRIHNEYGMTELSSQAYATGPNGLHRFPHWCRPTIIDPETNAVLPPGEMGYLIIHDLANLHSVAKIRTQDFAIAESAQPDTSFTLIGRDPGALPRGCSRSIDHALS